MVLLIADTNAPHTLSDGQYASRRGIIDAESGADVAQRGGWTRRFAAGMGPPPHDRVRFDDRDQGGT